MNTAMPTTSSSTKALLLFAHGSRQDRWREPFDQMVAKLRQQRSDLRIELAFLEFMKPSLSDMLIHIVEQNIVQICIVPLFFGMGNHVVRDLNELISAIKINYPHVQISVATAAGLSEQVLQSMSDYAQSCVGS